MILGYTFYSKLISIRRVIRVFVTTDDDDDCIYTKEMTIQNNVSNSPIWKYESGSSSSYILVIFSDVNELTVKIHLLTIYNNNDVII